MNSFTNAFSIYEVLRILVPGFYFCLMIGEIAYNISLKLKWKLINDTYQLLILIIAAIVVGALLYAMDIPRWFKKCYSTLPSSLIEKNREKLGLQEDNSKRPFEDSYYRFYYSLQYHTIFKTEIQSGFFHLLITMSFIGLITILVHATALALSVSVREYYFLNLFITIVSLIGAIVIYKSKLRYSWKRNYDEYVDNLNKKKE
jgi:hypothetical protein